MFLAGRQVIKKVVISSIAKSKNVLLYRITGSIKWTVYDLHFRSAWADYAINVLFIIKTDLQELTYPPPALTLPNICSTWF